MSNNSNQVERILNVVPSPSQEEDWTMADASAAEEWVEEPTLPDSIDYRNSWWKINDQKSTGSCVGWALADSVLRWYFVNADRIDENELLSPRYIWMAAKETDEFEDRPTSFIERSGTSLKAALDVARKFGVVKEPVLPFTSGDLFPNTTRHFYILAAKLRMASYFNLGQDLQNWRVWLATQGPILTRLDVDITWRNAKDTEGYLDVYHPPGRPAGHAVALIGYKPDLFIVRNSWGKDFGDKGFAYSSLDYAKAAFTEAYGVTV